MIIILHIIIIIIIFFTLNNNNKIQMFFPSRWKNGAYTFGLRIHFSLSCFWIEEEWNLLEGIIKNKKKRKKSYNFNYLYNPVIYGRDLKKKIKGTKCRQTNTYTYISWNTKRKKKYVYYIWRYVVYIREEKI